MSENSEHSFEEHGIRMSEVEPPHIVKFSSTFNGLKRVQKAENKLSEEIKDQSVTVQPEIIKKSENLHPGIRFSI